jgi:Protein of unknown function (DUF3761)
MKKLTVALAGFALAAVFALPVQAADTSGPVTCTDGTTSPHGGQGACSKHGGIKKDGAAAKAEAAAPAPAPAAAPKPAAAAAPPAAASKPAPAAKPAASTATPAHSVNNDAAGATAKCKDGSYSHSTTHSGTCSKHGGVAEWLDGTKK